MTLLDALQSVDVTLPDSEANVTEALERLRAATQGQLAFERASLPDGLPVSHDLVEWFAAGGPSGELPWVTGGVEVLGSSALADGQIGYRVHGLTGQIIKDWPGNWLVLAHLDGDPFVVDTALFGSPVRLARHGAGRWDPKPFAGSLAAFGSFLGIWAALMSEFDGSVFDDDFKLRPEFLSEAKDRCEPVLGVVGAHTLVDLLTT